MNERESEQVPDAYSAPPETAGFFVLLWLVVEAPHARRRTSLHHLFQNSPRSKDRTNSIASTPVNVGMKRSSFRVLIVDDSESDRFLLEKTFRELLEGHAVIRAVNDGETAIRYLKGDGEFGDRKKFPFPNLLISDLNMPVKDGLAVLEFMAHNPAWSVVPCIIFSSSDDADDIKKTYLLGGSGYHIKPSNAEERSATVRAIVEYWRRCEVPPVDESGRLLETESRGRVGERYPPPEGGAGMVRPS